MNELISFLWIGSMKKDSIVCCDDKEREHNESSSINKPSQGFNDIVYAFINWHESIKAAKSKLIDDTVSVWSMKIFITPLASWARIYSNLSHFPHHKAEFMAGRRRREESNIWQAALKFMLSWCVCHLPFCHQMKTVLARRCRCGPLTRSFIGSQAMSRRWQLLSSRASNELHINPHSINALHDVRAELFLIKHHSCASMRRLQKSFAHDWLALKWFGALLGWMRRWESWSS